MQYIGNVLGCVIAPAHVGLYHTQVRATSDELMAR